MKRVSKEGLSDGMFANWRYTEPGGRDENPDFVLNREPYRRAQILVALDQVTDPQNVGAVFRSAAAFGAVGVLLQARHAPPETGALARAASGGLEHVPRVEATNLARTLDRLRDAGWWVLGLAEEAADHIGDWEPASRVVLVLGAEGTGLRRLTRERCDQLVRLPTAPAMPSLNVSNAAAVALYALRQGEV